jgi:hypothetical protein
MRRHSGTILRIVVPQSADRPNTPCSGRNCACIARQIVSGMLHGHMVHGGCEAITCGLC